MSAVQSMTPPRRALSTPHQRLYARTLMRQLELDATRITLMHRRYVESAHLVMPELGALVDDFLGGLAKAEIGTLISVLKAEVGNDA